MSIWAGPRYCVRRDLMGDGDCRVNSDQFEGANWALGLGLTTLTIALHALGVVVLAVQSVRFRGWVYRRHIATRWLIPIVVGVVGTVGLSLVVLTSLEAFIWAIAYSQLGAVDRPFDAILYSVD